MPLAARGRVAATLLSLFTVAAQAEDTQNQANSVAVLSTADLEERGITTLNGIAEALPAISYVSALNSLSTLSLYMRGAGPTAPGQITLDGAVGLYQDGFYISRLQANTFDLLDLERVDVLAGPQGAAFGRDTTGGVINLTSQVPSGKLDFDESVDFGNRNSYRVLSSIDTPHWNGLSAKVTAVASGIDGYVNNVLGTQHNYGEEKQRAARLQLLWDGLENLRVAYFIERTGLDSTPEYDSNPAENGEELYPNFTYYADPNRAPQSTYRPVLLSLSTSNHTAQGLTLTWHALPALTVESLTGYRTMTANEFQDYTELYGQPTTTTDVYQQQQFSQDLRLSGDVLDRQIGYMAGVSYFKEQGTHADDFFLPVDSADQLTQVAAETRSEAVYAQLRWRPAFLERLEVTAADRYTQDIKNAERSIVDGSEEGVEPLESGALSHMGYKKSTPEFDIAYRWTAALTTYAKVSTAYQAGGALENAPLGEFATDVFRPETSRTYEVGLKSAFNDRLQADVALFDSKRKNVQYAIPEDIYSIYDDALDLERVTVRGASFDLRAQPLHDLALSASATYLHWSIDQANAKAGTVFDPATDTDSPYAVGENIKNVFALPYTPKYSATVAGDYTFLHLDRKDAMVHLDYIYRSQMFADAGAGPAVPGNQFDTQSAYGLLNGRITLSQETDWSHRLKFSLWGRNLLNRRFYQPAVGVGAGVTSYNTSGSEPTLAGYQSRAGAWSEPLTYGLNITYQY
jgi:iron complex outermembrane receptor protein